MKPANKTILFARVTVGKAVRQYPVGVFANVRTAKAFATHLHMAHRVQDPEMARRLDPKTPLDEDGKLYPDTKWSALEVPYEPGASPDGEVFEMESAASTT